MGLLVDGVWQQDGLRTKDGEFIRPATRFHHWVTPDGSAGPKGDGGFAAEPGRYHLYVSLACPWAHRTMIFRKLKGLENVISMSTVSPDMLKDGWTFNTDEGSSGDEVNGKSKLSEIYLLADAKYSGRVSVPVLWDKKRGTIVNNEFAGNHPHAQFGVRQVHQRPHRLLSGALARRDRCLERQDLLERQQRRLSRRLCHLARCLRKGVPRIVRHARRDGAAAVAAPLSHRQARSPRPTGGFSRR